MAVKLSATRMSSYAPPLICVHVMYTRQGGIPIPMIFMIKNAYVTI